MTPHGPGDPVTLTPDAMSQWTDRNLRRRPFAQSCVPAALLLCTVFAAAPAGCRARAGGDFTISSRDERAVLSPKFTTAVYLPVDPSTADVYLSDLPAKRIAD